MKAKSGYVPRLVDRVMEDLFGELPALLLTGPRATGKTTTALRHAKSVVRLDDDAQAAAFHADPSAALRRLEEPVLIDEWQMVPGVLAALKRTIDEDPRPARFIVTGSVRADIEGPTWPGTGRLVRIPMFGMTIRELSDRVAGASLLDVLGRGEVPQLSVSELDLVDYVELALRGGFPEPALGLSDRARDAWLASYVDNLVTRDAALAGEHRDPLRLRRYLEALAIHTATVVEDKVLYDAAGITRPTAEAYERLLQNLGVVEPLPAWVSHRTKRLTRAAKRHLVDPSLLVGTLGTDTDAVLRDGALLGRLIDSFVTAQLRAEATASERRPRLYHLRQEKGLHEVDLVIEVKGGGLIAIEIKAGAAPTPTDAKHLRWLRDQLGDQFLMGVVFHTGPLQFELAERVHALPISALWQA